MRGLRQRVELAFVHARGNQEVARTLGRGLGQDRGFDVLEAARVEPAPQRADQLRADAHLALHLGRAQVEVAVPEADVLARSEEHTSELQSLMRISYAVFCLKKQKQNTHTSEHDHPIHTSKYNILLYNQQHY